MANYCKKSSLFLEYFQKKIIFVILAYELPNRIFFLKKSDTFFFWILINFWKVVHDSQWQVHLSWSNINSKVFYVVLLHFKQLKSLFWANLMIFKNSWLFSESFGYFMHHSYQIRLIWLKIQILWLILDWIDISNQSLGPLGIKRAVLVLEPQYSRQ